MDISPAQVGDAIQVALQRQMLSVMKTQGADIAALIASAPSPAGSVNLPGQGTHLDSTR
jgi:type II secretory pathway component PulM